MEKSGLKNWVEIIWKGIEIRGFFAGGLCGRRKGGGGCRGDDDGGGGRGNQGWFLVYHPSCEDVL